MFFIQKLFAKNFKNINSEELQNLIKENQDILLLDVRTVGEYKEGHIPNAKNIPLDNLEQQINYIKKYTDKPIVLYCASGARSKMASNILGRLGFTNIYNLSRGIYSYKGKLNTK